MDENIRAVVRDYQATGETSLSVPELMNCLMRTCAKLDQYENAPKVDCIGDVARALLLPSPPASWAAALEELEVHLKAHRGKVERETRGQCGAQVAEAMELSIGSWEQILRDLRVVRAREKVLRWKRA